MKIILFSTLLLVSSQFPTTGGASSAQGEVAVKGVVASSDTLSPSAVPSCREEKLEVERLPDMHEARAGHLSYYLGGELVVIGGHTHGFVPSTTAEYYRSGHWHQVPMVYTHDNAFGVPLRSGKVFIAGGHEKALGIGQTYGIELYDPLTHRFEGLSCLDRKRCLASAIETDSGHVLISGNHYADDAIELFDGTSHCHHVKDVAQARCCPYLFRTSSGDVMIFSTEGTHATPHDSIIIDRLHGQPFHVSLLDTYRPLFFTVKSDVAESFIGDESRGEYAYLLPVEDPGGQLYIMEVRDTVFSILPTTAPIPHYSRWGKVRYCSNLLVDRKARRAYLMGIDASCNPGTRQEAAYRHYVLSIDYSQSPATPTLYYTDAMPSYLMSSLTMTDEGDLVLTGGSAFNGNFTPSSTAYLLRVGRHEDTAAHRSLSWFLAGIACMVSLLALYTVWMRKKKLSAGTSEDSDAQESHDETARHDEVLLPDAVGCQDHSSPAAHDSALMRRIDLLMTREKVFQRSDLKIIDIAALVGSNRNTVSNIINRERRCSFNQFVNGYRVAYAKELLRRKPEMKMVEVYVASGFSNDTSFFRTFKAFTGMTPKEWREKND